MEYLSKEMKKKFLQESRELKLKEKKWKKEEKAAERELMLATMKEEKSNTHTAKKPAIMELLNNLWFDEDKGIETQDALFRAAKKVEPATTLDDVKEFLRKEPTEQVKDTPGSNSWVGSLPREQYHVDIAYITQKPTKRRTDPRQNKTRCPQMKMQKKRTSPNPKPKPKPKRKPKPNPKACRTYPRYGEARTRRSYA